MIKLAIFMLEFLFSYYCTNTVLKTEVLLWFFYFFFIISQKRKIYNISLVHKHIISIGIWFADFSLLCHGT
jgi:hypothetical protein